MPRFYWAYREMSDDTFDYCVFDRRRGSDQQIAIATSSDDAEKIVDALNAYKAPSVGVFG